MEEDDDHRTIASGLGSVPIVLLNNRFHFAGWRSVYDTVLMAA